MKICTVYDENNVYDSICHKWFRNFYVSNFNFILSSHSEQLSDADGYNMWTLTANCEHKLLEKSHNFLQHPSNTINVDVQLK